MILMSIECSFPRIPVTLLLFFHLGTTKLSLFTITKTHVLTCDVECIAEKHHLESAQQTEGNSSHGHSSPECDVGDCFNQIKYLSMCSSISSEESMSKQKSTYFATQANVEKKTPVKPFSAIPGPRPMPIIGNVWNYLPGIGTYNGNDVNTFTKINEEYGDMVKLHMPKFNVVFLFSPQLIREVFMKEGKIPRRPGLDALEKHRTSKPEVYSNTGLLLEQGEVWKDLRSKVQKHMLRINAVQAYAEQMSRVTNDFTARIKRHRRTNMEVDDFINEIMKWGLESVGVVTLSRRLGCLADSLTKDSEPQKLIDSVLASFRALHNLENSLFGLWKIIPTPNYRSLVKAQTYFETVITKYLKNAVENLKDDSNSDTNNILNAILLESNNDLKKVTSIMMDTFLAGVDTTSVTASFLLYELSINPDKQEKVYQEVCKIIPDKNAMITGEQLDKLEYLNACIKESMRMHPVTVGTARILDHDIELNGYLIPAKTQLAQVWVTYNKSEKHFANSDKFLPERWLKSEVGRENLPNQFAYVPFGYGSRMCVGFRIAEQEIRILVSKVCGGFIDDNHEYEETEELYIQPNLFIRKFNQPRFKNFTRVGLNISIPVFKKYNQLYAIKFSIPGQDPPFRNCQVIRLKQTPKNAAIIWNDQFWFRNSDTKRNFSVKVIGLPSRKQQTFHGEVPPEKDLGYTGDESNWTPVIFMQTTNDKIIITFSSVNLISEYTVELIRGKKVEQKEIVFSTGPVQKVYFTDLFEGDYVINVKKCIVIINFYNRHCFDITSSYHIIVFLIFSKHTIQPKILRKVLILQSYDCKIHEEFIFALVKALRECHFDVLIDKYRDVETSYDILHWIPEAVKQSHLVLIIWSQGALNKDNDDIKQQDPGNTVSANWNFALRQVEKKLHDFDFEVANVFWDKKINRNDIKPAFIGFQDIFLTNKLVKDWKSLLSFLYCKDFLWKRKICKFYKQDLSSFDDEGKALLEAYDNLKSYK
uniref:SEFIR domain-containing protein n=1 Tax=Strigamia maritima TaxID=126957 RepID=T1J6L3_STRMM